MAKPWGPGSVATSPKGATLPMIDDEDRYRDLPDSVALDIAAFAITVCLMFVAAGILSLF